MSSCAHMGWAKSSPALAGGANVCRAVAGRAAGCAASGSTKKVRTLPGGAKAGRVVAGCDEGGFTLIEALVALALGVSVVAVVLSTLHIASNGATKAVAVAAEAEAFARAGAVLAGDALHGLRLRDGQGDVVFKGQPLGVTFPVAARFGGAPVALEFDLRPAIGGTDLMRTEAALLAEGAAGPFGLAQPIWHAAGPWEFRYLDDKGAWLRQWTAKGLPRAFGLVALTASQTVELVAAFPDLMEPDCALGPGPKCSLAAEVFP